MVSIPPRNYIIIRNPVQKDESGVPILDKHGTVKVRNGDLEVRFSEDYPQPFPLYPEEKI